jgi:hypothetical protein
MKPAREKYYRNLFTVAALYDLLLGLTFALFPVRTYAALGIADQLPAFRGYIRLLGAFVLVLGIAYALISRGNLRNNADLILVGTLFKLAYAVAALYYWATNGLPHVMFGVLGVADAIFFVLIAECWLCLRREAKN